MDYEYEEDLEIKPVVLTKCKAKVKAIDTGYYNNKVIRTGEKFVFEGNLKDGKLPLWVELVEAIEGFEGSEEKKKPAKKAKVKASEVDELV